MINVEIHAIQWSKKFGMSIDEECLVEELSRIIESILEQEKMIEADCKKKGILMNGNLFGVLPLNKTLCECDIRTGSKLICFFV